MAADGSLNPENESDIQKRTKNKFKRTGTGNDDEILESSDSHPEGQQPVQNGSGSSFSYKDMLTGDKDDPKNWSDWSASDMDDEMQFDNCVSDDEAIEDSKEPRVTFSREEKINALLRNEVEEKMEMRKPWQKALIVKLLGKTLGFQALSARVKQMWQLEGR